MKKQINLLIIATVLAMTTTTFAETCPNLDGKKFNSLSEYNQFRNSVAGQYTLPDMSGEITLFPITLGKTEYVYMHSKTNMSQTAPFLGDNLSCYISWTGANWEQQDGIIKINYPVKSTSNDWDAMDDQTAECQNPAGDNTCTFDRNA
jgi:hypothetical protein